MQGEGRREREREGRMERGREGGREGGIEEEREGERESDRGMDRLTFSDIIANGRRSRGRRKKQLLSDRKRTRRRKALLVAFLAFYSVYGLVVYGYVHECDMSVYVDWFAWLCACIFGNDY